MYVTTDTPVAGGTVLHIESTAGEGVLTYETANDFSVIVFSSPELVAGETYNVYFDGTAAGDSSSGLYDANAYTPGTLVGTATAA